MKVSAQLAKKRMPGLTRKIRHTAKNERNNHGKQVELTEV